MLKTTASFAFATLVASLPALPASLSLACELGPVVTISAAAPAASATVNCPQFNPTLGTLTQVIASGPMLSGNDPRAITGTFSMQNNSGAPIDPGTLFILELSAQLGGGTPFANRTATNQFVGSNVVIAPGATATVTAPPQSWVFQVPWFAGPDASLIGGGTFALPMEFAFSRDLAGNRAPGLTLLDFSIQFPASASIQFEYDERAPESGVPEPGVELLLGTGLGALLAIRWWRRS